MTGQPTGAGEPEHYSGSPFLAHLGTCLDEWREGYISIGLVLQPFHLNRSGVVHGGVLAALLDHSGGFSGLYSADPLVKRRGVTLSLTSNYIKQTSAGRITAIGRRVSGGRKIFFAQSEVWTDSGVLLANSTGVYRYRTGSEAGAET